MGKKSNKGLRLLNTKEYGDSTDITRLRKELVTSSTDSTGETEGRNRYPRKFHNRQWN